MYMCNLCMRMLHEVPIFADLQANRLRRCTVVKYKALRLRLRERTHVRDRSRMWKVTQ
ncbi:hypothetical protein IX308_000899 [Porphyromonas levii]|nr:hypothetical protein [Porphyromonas levii]MBR8784718.1 hypothetical protein [Porphyromonas levii]